ncbi:MAG: hypothetical protein Fur0043_08160 [Anaerolineales bacterium]
MDTFTLIPGTLPANPGPLARFLPPLEEGVVSAWLRDNLKPGAWLLDPFGAAPRLSLEAARSGYRVLTAANNPIMRFLLEIGAASLAAAEFKAALAALAASRKGEERLEGHLRALYLTPCANCQREVPAQAFLWRKEEEMPYGRLYRCPACGDSGERLVGPADLQRAAEAARSAGLARARVLERVAPLGDPDREYAEEAIQHYPPRALYALATLVNRLDGLQLTPARRRALMALILSACDAGNALWPHPTQRPRPRQLSIPPQYLENNLWLALEGAIGLWAGTHASLPCARWPKAQEVPESGGLLLYEGRIRDLAAAVKSIPIQAVIGALPRPNQAFWTLSALWAGWLWGREAAEPFKVVLRRRRYDWGWHASALYAALQHVAGLLPLGAPFFGLLAEAEPGFLTAALMAASSAGFDLRGMALRTVHDPLQLMWTRGERLHRAAEQVNLEDIRAAMREHLRERGEPAAYFALYVSGLGKQARGPAWMRPAGDFDQGMRETQSLIQQALQSDEQLERLDADERSLEVGLWDLTPGQERAEPLADRVERAVVMFLQKNPGCTVLDLERDLYPQFAPLMAPPRALVQAVLDSYALQQGGRWQLRPEDRAAARRAELGRMTTLVRAIGERLGYTVEQPGETICLWLEAGQPLRAFYLLASALVGNVLARNRYPIENCLLVIPGGRAGLLAYKQTRDPNLRLALAGWRIVKFRLLRALADIPVLNRQTFEEQIASDPVQQSQGQMMMF